MAVIDRVDAVRVRSWAEHREYGPLSLLLDFDVAAPGVDELVTEVRAEIADEVWAWYREHSEDTALRVRVAFLTVYRVRVGQLDWLIERLVGPEPEKPTEVSDP